MPRRLRPRQNAYFEDLIFRAFSGPTKMQREISGSKPLLSPSPSLPLSLALSLKV